jgi:hypothetical protein
MTKHSAATTLAGLATAASAGSFRSAPLRDGFGRLAEG